MTTMAIERDCGCGDSTSSSGEALLPVNPFTALQYHFGMLLGVDDLEAAQAYPRGKIRLHNAWLHREGVVWGYDVLFNKRRELAVRPGLLLDGAGRELHLDTTACVDIGRWFEKHRDDESFTFSSNDAGQAQFDVHVVARFRACLARPVPAIADPCGSADSDTAFSRVNESVELLLRPGKSQRKDPGYHRLRILFALEDDEPTRFDEVRVRRESILALPIDQQPRAYLEAFREFAALDVIDLAPATDESGVRNSLFPEDPTEVVLADVSAVIVGPASNGAPGWTLADPLPEINVRVRPSHVATATIQELLCGPLFAAPISAPVDPEPSEPVDPANPTEPNPPASPTADAGGPRIDRESVHTEQRRRSASVVMSITAPIDDASATRDQFSVTAYTSADGWKTVDINKVILDNAALTVTLDLQFVIDHELMLRVIAKGTGPQPLLGKDLVPFAGAVGGPAGTIHEGHDFHIMLRSS